MWKVRSSVIRVCTTDLNSGVATNRLSDTKQTRVVKKTVPTETFFNFFTPPKAPAEDGEAASDIEERLELDYQLGEDIKEKLIARAIDWFTGAALAFEELDEDGEDAEFEDEDDEDEDDEEERDEDDESDDEVKMITDPTLTRHPDADRG